MNASAAAPIDAPARGTVTLTFPDQSTRTFPAGVTAAEVARSISPSLAKSALVAEIDGELRDLDLPIAADARLRLIRAEDPEALAVIRHDCAHVMAEAVQDLFPGTQVTIGPADRERLLLRLLPERAVLERRPRADRGAHGRDRARQPSRSSARR